MKDRVQIKHDIAANWAKAKNFIPLPGELIIYDGIVEDGKYLEVPKLKIGDGKTKLIDLPFIDSISSEKDEKKYVYYDETIELI
jgi:hypothetical protein